MIARSLKVLEHYQLLQDAKLQEAQIKIICPFHQEEEPSCNVWLEAERFYCFGCNAQGDLADLVSKLDHVNRLSALLLISRIMRDLEEAYKGELGAKIILAQQFADRPQVTTAEAIEQAKGFFFSLAKPPWDDISNHYLIDERGFTTTTLKRFDARINSSGDYPIIFPIWDAGTFKGYMTRTLDNREDKYRMSRGMRKTEILYGRVKRMTVVTEGVFDAWKTWQNLRAIDRKGVGVVSPLNWASSDQQVQKLAGAEVVISALDNDDAGRQGYELLKQKLDVPVVRYPLPSWIHDMAELEPREFQAGLAIACKAL